MNTANKLHTDFIVIGAGIVGLTVARELKNRFRDASVAILDKEPRVGLHSSGRNSGVLHSGIYYKEGSLKAKVCAAGAREMAAFCEANRLPVRQLGKIILPTREEEDSQLDLLASRTLANNVQAEIINQQQIGEIEPFANPAITRALYVPGATVVDPAAILQRLVEELQILKVRIILGQTVQDIDVDAGRMVTDEQSISFGHLVNSAGLHADRVAQACGAGRGFTMLPFKGIYYDLGRQSGITINGLLYPVPDLRMPFLGVHFTKTVQGKVILGPTALPALGRENYRGLDDVTVREAGRILRRLVRQYMANNQGFRLYAGSEALRFIKGRFAAAARALVPAISTSHLTLSHKVGIRAQLVDLKKEELVMDFMVENGKNSTHILNAISPAFTCSFPLARLVVDRVDRRETTEIKASVAGA